LEEDAFVGKVDFIEFLDSVVFWLEVAHEDAEAGAHGDEDDGDEVIAREDLAQEGGRQQAVEDHGQGSRRARSDHISIGEAPEVDAEGQDEAAHPYMELDRQEEMPFDLFCLQVG